MRVQERRKKILDVLVKAEEPLTGGELAGKFAVSRQVIVQDIALLRARGEEILATPRGYILVSKLRKEMITATLVCQHSPAEMETELLAIVRLGGKVLDVTVEHPLYGELRGLLMINSLQDIHRFMEKINRTAARPLSDLTAGLHLHTVEVSDAVSLQEIKMALRKLGFLMEE